MGGVRTVKPYTRAAGPPGPAPRALTVPSLWTAHALYRSIDYTFPSFGSLPNPGPRPEHFSQARAHFLQNRSICSDCHSSMRLLISRGVIGCAVLPTEWDSKGGVMGLAVILGIVAAVAYRWGYPVAAAIGTTSVFLALPAVPCLRFERFRSGATSMAVMSDEASTRPRVCTDTSASGPQSQRPHDVCAAASRDPQPQQRSR